MSSRLLMVNYKPKADFGGLRGKTMRYLFSRGFRKVLFIGVILVSLLLNVLLLFVLSASYGGIIEAEDIVERQIPPPFRKHSSYRVMEERPDDTFQEAARASTGNQRKSLYNNGLHDEHCNPWRDDKINIHLIPHSHDDVGWLKTVEQYYWGDHNEIQNAGVQYIIDSVISEVARQPDRRFVFAEMAFLYRWWRRQNEASRNLLRRLLERGQIEIICGGWSMADEAATDYVSLIDQHTTGFNFITGEIDPNYRPLIGWQIDTFGHSRETASLFAEMGMNGLFFARLDYQERKQRESTRTSEMVWQLRPKSPDLGLSLFTSMLTRGKYGQQTGFRFEFAERHERPIIDDPDVDGYNAPTRVANFEKLMDEEKSRYPSNHLLATMGDDFSYVNSNPWYVNMDALIKATNNMSQTYHMLYSTPSCYTKAVFESVRKLTNKTDDFFPYAPRPEGYWTGYFTSRPSLKRIVRDVTNWFVTVRQLVALSEAPIDSKTKAALFSMQDVQGILQHHDAVTGTSKQTVTDDYRKMASIALHHGRNLSSQVLRELHCKRKEDKMAKDCALEDPLQFCHAINETQCQFSEGHESFAVIVYNPLAKLTNTWLRIPLWLKDPLNARIAVTDPIGDAVSADLIPVLDDVKSIPTRSSSNASHELVFKVAIPPMGSSVYFVQSGKNTENLAKTVVAKPYAKSLASTATKRDGKTVAVVGQVIDNGKLRLSLDDKGRLNALENLEENVTVAFTHYLAFYNASHDLLSPLPGAYIFNPDSAQPNLYTDKPTTVIIPGEQVVEIHQTYASWAKAIIRLYAGEAQLEVQWIVGPIPTLPGSIEELDKAAAKQQWGGRFGNNVGREVVSIFQSNIDSKEIFYTDANGREMLQRKKDFRDSWNFEGTEPVSQNYYPLNSRISTNDSKAQMTVIIDRAAGGTGMRNGQLEVMVHRRLVHDDSLGVGEPLQEVESGMPLVATGRQWVMVNTPKNAPQHYRTYSQRVMFPPIIAFSKLSSRDEWLKEDLDTVTSLGAAVTSKEVREISLLPSNVHLLTLERDFQDCTFMLRLEHLYEGREDEKLANPVQVEFDKFVRKLVGKAASSVQIEELALGANMPVRDLVRLKWDTTEEDVGSSNPTQSRIKRQALKPGEEGEYEKKGKNDDYVRGSSKALRYDKLGERMLADWRTDGWRSITLLPMQIRTFCLRVKSKT